MLIPKSRFKKRKSKKGKRGERDGDSTAYVADLHELGCCICSSPSCEVHHLRSSAFGRGMALKSLDRYSLPLCREHHDEIHLSGSRTEAEDFLTLAGFDGSTLADILWAAWSENKDVVELKEAFYKFMREHDNERDN